MYGPGNIDTAPPPPPPWKVIGNSEGEGGLLKKMNEANLGIHTGPGKSWNFTLAFSRTGKDLTYRGCGDQTQAF